MNYSKRKINKLLGFKLQGGLRLKNSVLETLAIFPSDIVDFVTKHCWFVGSMNDAFGFTLKGEEIGKGNYLIFLSDELLAQSDYQICYTIAHEIGHVALGHKNSILKYQTKGEVKNQEAEADNFAKHYLNLGLRGAGGF